MKNSLCHLKINLPADKFTDIHDIIYSYNELLHACVYMGLGIVDVQLFKHLSLLIITGGSAVSIENGDFAWSKTGKPVISR